MDELVASGHHQVHAPLLGDFPVQVSNNMEAQTEVIDEYRMTIDNASVARPRFNGVAV
jgi:hypothetical protein